MGKPEIRSGDRVTSVATMQPAAVKTEQVTDLAASVVATLRQMGVAALPRNYEVFYEALSGTNHELSLEVVSLSKRPTQEDVDRIGRKYFAHHHGLSVVDSARDLIASELEQVATLLRTERSHLEKYGQILNQTNDGLSGRQVASQDLLQKILTVMTVATSSTIEHGRQTALTLNEKSAELESVKCKLEEYKKLADTDPLSQLSNRRAFDQELARVYDLRGGVMFKALILVDIDHFKDINDRFGHPAGDKVIQVIADSFRQTLRMGTFVARTGGEEFAVIVEGGGEDGTARIAERLRHAVEQASPASILGSAVTVSLGVCMATDADGPDDLYAKADRALYRSKLGGRNRVTRHSATPDARSSKGWMLYRAE